MALAFAGIYIFSKMDTSERARIDRAGFLPQYVRSQTGIGASSAAAH
jgi:cation/acetate symporter